MKLWYWTNAPGPYMVAFSTRLGGVSEGRFASLNPGLLTKDDPGKVARNRRLLCDRVGVDFERLAMNRQVHGTTVLRAAVGQRGEPGDGLWTDEAGLPLLALAADCAPIVLARIGWEDPALAVLHAGRIGVLEGIVEAGVRALGGEVAAAVGPCIDSCCYRVGPEVAAPYAQRFGAEVLFDDGEFLSLRRAAERALHEAGCRWVEHFRGCTSCHPELFFSHRRDGPETGRQGVIAALV